jgi:hypothetical protein
MDSEMKRSVDKDARLRRKHDIPVFRAGTPLNAEVVDGAIQQIRRERDHVNGAFSVSKKDEPGANSLRLGETYFSSANTR